MQLRHRIEYAATAFMLGICRRLPANAVYRLFRGFGKLMYHVLASRTKLVLRNMEIAFPGKTLEERKVLAKNCYANLSDSMAFNTLMMCGRFTNEELLESVEIEGWENYEKAMALTKKGLLIFTAHIGNWELLPQYAALRLDEKIYAVARKTTNPLLEEKIVLPLRERFGVDVFYKKNALMRIMKALNKGGHAGILIDQKLQPPEGIYVDFFGKKAPTTGSSGLLQVRFGVIALPAFMVKIGSGKHRLILREPIQWEDNGKSMEDQVFELTRIHQQIVEEIIQEYPDQWFWMHNRWGLKKSER